MVIYFDNNVKIIVIVGLRLKLGQNTVRTNFGLRPSNGSEDLKLGTCDKISMVYVCITLNFGTRVL